MNDLIIQEQELLPFDYSTLNLNIQDVEFLKSKELSIKVRTSQTIFENGRDLLEAKEKVGHGNFLKWVEGCFPWSQDTANRYMNVAKSFQNTHGAEFQKIQAKALYLLSAPSTPEVVRQEAVELAESGETVTHAKAKELAAENKEIEALKAKLAEKEEQLLLVTKPTIYPLMSNIQELLNKGQIMPAKAKALQTLTAEGQSVWFTEYVSKFSLENQLNEERRTAQKALEKAMKAIEEKEAAIAKLSEVTENPQTAEIIAKHELQLKHMKERYEMDLRESEKRIAREATEFQAKVHREKIEEAIKAKEKAERDAKQKNDHYNALAAESHKLKSKIESLEEQLEVNTPTNIDLARARAIKEATELFHNQLIRFEDDRKTCGGTMEKSLAAVDNAISTLSAWRNRVKGIDYIDI